MENNSLLVCCFPPSKLVFINRIKIGSNSTFDSIGFSQKTDSIQLMTRVS